MRIFRTTAALALVASATAFVSTEGAAADDQTLTVMPSTELLDRQLVDVVATGIEATDGLTDFPFVGTLTPSVHQCAASFAAPAGPTATSTLLFEVAALCIELDTPDVADGIANTSVRVRDTIDVGFAGTVTRTDCRLETCQLVVLAGEGSLGEDIAIQFAEAVPLRFTSRLGIDTAVVREANDGTTTASITVRLNPSTDQDLFLNYEIEGETATAGIDFVAASGSVVLPAGQTEVLIPFEVLDDFDVEGNETGRVTVTTNPDQPGFGSPAIGQFVIVDNEMSVSPSAGLANGDVVRVQASGVVNNGGVDTVIDGIKFQPGIYQCDAAVDAFNVPTATGIVELDAWTRGIDDNCALLAAGVPIENALIDAEVSVTSSFEAGNVVDFNAAPRTVDCNTDECVMLVLAASGVPITTLEITVDYFETVPLSFGASITPGVALVASEGDTGSSVWAVPVRLSAPLDESVTVEFRTVDDPNQSAVAVSGTDYIATSGTLTFQPGQTEAFVPVEILGDTAVEPPLLWGEWGIIQFENPSDNAVINTAPFFGASIFIILDDDN